MIGQAERQFGYVFITQIRYHRHGDVLRCVLPVRAQIAALNLPLGSLPRVWHDLVPAEVLIGHRQAQRRRHPADQVIDMPLCVPAVRFKASQVAVGVPQFVSFNVQ